MNKTTSRFILGAMAAFCLAEGSAWGICAGSGAVAVRGLQMAKKAGGGRFFLAAEGGGG